MRHTLIAMPAIVSALAAAFTLGEAVSQTPTHWTNRAAVLHVFDTDTDRAVSALEEGIDLWIADPGKTSPYAFIEARLFPASGSAERNARIETLHKQVVELFGDNSEEVRLFAATFPKEFPFPESIKATEVR